MSTGRKSNAQSRRAAGAPARRSTPPYNPGLQKLVEGKQAWTVPLDDDAKAKGFLGWHQRGYVPHYDAPGLTQIVTIRLADSLPASRRGEWEHLLSIEDDRQRRRRLEEYLDRGLGECWLGRPEIATLAESALRHFDGERYGLGAWVVMPNHLHLLVDVWDVPLSKLIAGWKSFIAHEANQVLHRTGEFWQREYLDTVIRDETHRRTAVKYIENNPVKAGFVREAKEWNWSSARHRDDYGNLPPVPAKGASAERSAAVPSALDERKVEG